MELQKQLVCIHPPPIQGRRNIGALRRRRNQIAAMNRIPIYRVQLVRDGSCKLGGHDCSSPADAADLFRALVGDADREHLVAMFLDTQNRFIGVHTISIGTLEVTVVHPREVFKAAILANAASMVLAHNHPSGRSEPSDMDILVTREMVQAGQLLDIPVMDHVVVGQPGFTSLLMTGFVKELEDGMSDEPQVKAPKGRKRKETRA